jgi:hypothetical protein
MILRGWKSICAAAGGMSEDTARKLMRHGGMPVAIIGGKPMTTTEALEEWVQCRCQGIDLQGLSAQLSEAVIDKPSRSR